MSIWKKAISAGATAALLGSLFATALAPTVSAAAVMSPTTGPNTGGTLVSVSGGSGYNVTTQIQYCPNEPNGGYTLSPTSVSPDGTAITFVTNDVSPYIGLCQVNVTGTIGLTGFFVTASAPGPVTLTPSSGKSVPPGTGTPTVVTLNAPGQYIDTSFVPADLTVNAVPVALAVRNNGESVSFTMPDNSCPAAGGSVSVTLTNNGPYPDIIGIPAFSCVGTSTAVYTLAPTGGPTGTVAQVTYDPGTFDLLCKITFGAYPGAVNTRATLSPTSVAGDGSRLTFVVPSKFDDGTTAVPTGTNLVTVGGCSSGASAKSAGNFTVTSTAGGAGNVSPANVSTNGGTVVQVTASSTQSFSIATQVRLETGSPLAVCTNVLIPTSVASDGKSLTFVMPKKADLAGCTVASDNKVNVWVTPLTSASGTVTYTAPAGPPIVTSISPNTGSRAGGNTVTITGSGFVSGATVAFGTTAATSVTFVSATSLTVVAPSGVGVVPVTVRNPDGQSGQLPNAYTYTDTGYVCGAGTALNVTTTGPFGTATVVAKPNQYVTYKFSCGVAGAGQKYTILGAKKNANGTWGAFTAVTSRIADSGGNVYYYVRTTGNQWWSFRMQIASSFSPARQARWL